MCPIPPIWECCPPDSYNKYTSICARATRQALKEEERVKAEKRGYMALRYQEWKEGKAGDQVRFKLPSDLAFPNDCPLIPPIFPRRSIWLKKRKHRRRTIAISLFLSFQGIFGKLYIKDKRKAWFRVWRERGKEGKTEYTIDWGVFAGNCKWYYIGDST